MSSDGTIFALASGIGRAAIAVIRLSGPAAGPILQALGGPPPPPRQIGLRRLRDDAGEILDHALVLWLPGPGSYSGEDMAELHVHAGPAVIDAVASALVALGARPAEPGEFTRRAVLNGRMELTQAEAVADLIDAESSSQRQQALRQLNGDLGRLIDGWTHRVTCLLAVAEAQIDFPDETSEPSPDADALGSLIADIEVQMADDRRGERLRDGVRVAVIGPVNAGKSSIVNMLSGRPAAIVSPQPGTTRDIIEVPAILAGVRLVLCDTAGIRKTDDLVEAEGVRRAVACAADADVVINVAAAGTLSGIDDEPGWIGVTSKTDLAPARPDSVAASIVTPGGLDALRNSLSAALRAWTWRSGPAPLTRARHRAACQQSLAHLRAAADLCQAELRAEELRLAGRALARITGLVGVEQVLDVVFSQFCIGK